MKQKKHRSLWLWFDRVLSHDLLKQVFILLGVLAVIFVVSLVVLSLSGDDWLAFCEEHHINRFVFPLYLLIDSNAFNQFYMSKEMEASTTAVFWGCIIYVVGIVVFTGMIISVMTNMISSRVADHKAGLLHYLRSGHYIIMGYDEMVPSFITHIFQKDPQAYVLLLSSLPTENIREKLSKTFNAAEMKRIIVNYGHRTSPEAYREIHLESAEQVYIVGFHSQPAHDAINVECVDSICRYLVQSGVNSRPSRIVCVFKDLDTYAAFKTSEIFGQVGQLGIEFVPYNFFHGWAKQVFVKRCYRDRNDPTRLHHYPAVYDQGIGPDDPRYVHLVFVGTTNFAVAFAMEAANVLHFPNFPQNGKLKTRITFIDLNADREKDEFITRNRHFFEIQSYRYQDLSPDSETPKSIVVPPTRFSGSDADFLDVEFEFIKGDVFSQAVQQEISRWATDRQGQCLSIFLAMADQRSNFVMGMNMPDEVYTNQVPVFIRQDRSADLVTLLRTADQGQSGRHAHIYPFGMNDTAYSADEHSLRRAKLINYLYTTANYDTYRFQSLLALDALSKDTIWAEADKYWRGLSVALKWSNLYNAYTIRTKLATLRAMRGLALEDDSRDQDLLSDEEVEKLAWVEHNRWNVEKLLMGYRKPLPHEVKDKHGSQLAKNKKLFIHHDIRPFNKLGQVKELDCEFSRYIPWIMRMTEENN